MDGGGPPVLLLEEVRDRRLGVRRLRLHHGGYRGGQLKRKRRTRPRAVRSLNRMALPMVNPEAISVQQRDAVVQSLVYSYVRDRETFNQPRQRCAGAFRPGKILGRGA